MAEQVLPDDFREFLKLLPMRIEVLTEIDGVAFDECYAARLTVEIDGQLVHVISREHLRKNKKASARHKDMDDLDNLPESPQGTDFATPSQS